MDPKIDNRGESPGRGRSTGSRPADASASEQVRETAQEAGREIKKQAAAAQERAQEAGEQAVEEGKQRLGEELGVYRKAIKRAAESLEEESETSAASLLRSAAESLNRAQKRIDERDLKGLLRDAEDVVRKNPQAAFGGLFLAGIATARFLRASADPDGREGGNTRRAVTSSNTRTNGGFKPAQSSRSGSVRSAKPEERAL